MPKPDRLSRLNPAYLAARHGGLVFLCLAVCGAAGMIWALVGVPVDYRAEAAKSFVVRPATAAADLDLAGRAEAWGRLFADPAAPALATANLRFKAKLALTHNRQWPDDYLAGELTRFEPVRIYTPVSERLWGVVVKLGLVSDERMVTLTRRDLAANLDFQSLAKIVADFDPPHDAPSWDFSFFHEAGADAPAGYIVVRPGPEDRFFRVFYHLHDLLYPGYPAGSPEEAWRSAVEELTARLDREATFPGGGGFGPAARLELARELDSIPTLIANDLYAAPFEVYGGYPANARWNAFWQDNLTLTMRPANAGGSLEAAADLASSPLRRRRDTLFSRLPALAVGLALDTVEATERRQTSSPAARSEPPPPVAIPEPEPAPPSVPEPEPEVRPAMPAVDTAALDAEAAEDRERITLLEDRIRLARLDRDAAKQRLEAFWAEHNGLVQEAVAARQRADAMRARYEDAKHAAESEEPALPLEAVRLMLARDEIVESLTLLLQSSTEDHPLVRQARRELAAIDELLAGLDLDALRAQQAEAGETRLRNMYLEWDGAENAWSALEQRRRRRNAEGAAMLAELELMERTHSDLEAELLRLRDLAARRAAERAALLDLAAGPAEPPPVSPRQIAAPSPTPAPADTPVVTPPATPATPAGPVAPVIEFDPTPAFIPVIRRAPPWQWAALGALAGLCLGCIILLARELMATRFKNVYQARRLVNLPLLAALPAYNPKSLREAAKTMQGEVGGKGERLSFVPLAVDYVEPPPRARRGSIAVRRVRPRLWPWLVGLLALALAGAVYYQAHRQRQRDAGDLAGAVVSPTAADYQAWRGVAAVPPGRSQP